MDSSPLKKGISAKTYATRLAVRRRMTRLTNAFSKTTEGHENALSLYFAYYNFCRVHSTIKTTPVLAQGLTDHVWSVEKLVKSVAEF